MKRGEMIDKIQLLLETQSHNGTAYRFKALEILELVEKAGMAPPQVSMEDKQAIMHVYYAGYTFRQWDEDLAKDEKVQEAKKRKQEAKLEREKKRKIKQLE